MYVGRVSRRSTNVDCGGSIPRPQKPKTPVKKIPISPHSSEEKVSDNSNSSSFTTLDNISEDAVVCILSFLSPDEISACRCLNRRLRDLCSDDRRVWLAVCQRRWGASTEVRSWGSGKIEYRLLYDILERWDNLVGFWRGVGHGGNGPLVVFDWGPCCIVASRIMPVKVGSYEVCKVPFLWTGVSGEGKSLSFINPDWLPDSGFSKGKGIEGGSGLFTVIDDGGFQLFSGLDGGADGGSGFSEGKKDENMCNGFRLDKVKNPFENMDLEDCVPAGLMSVNLSFVGNSHIVVEENQDRRWVKNRQAQELLLGRSNSYSDLSKKRSAVLENGACSPPGSLPDRLQSEIYEYFANKVSPSGVRAARKQRRKDKERAAGYGRRKWEAEHFVKVAHWSPTPARPLQGLWKGIFDSMGLDFILVSYDEYGGIVCRKVGEFSQTFSGCGSVFWTADSASFVGLPLPPKEEELYSSRMHIRPRDSTETDSSKCTMYEDEEVTRVLCIIPNSDVFRHSTSVPADGRMEGRLWQYASGRFGFGFLNGNSIVDFKHIGSSGCLLDIID